MFGFGKNVLVVSKEANSLIAPITLLHFKNNLNKQYK
jgi:hypothetical protein